MSRALVPDDAPTARCRVPPMGTDRGTTQGGRRPQAARRILRPRHPPDGLSARHSRNVRFGGLSDLDGEGGRGVPGLRGRRVPGREDLSDQQHGLSESAAARRGRAAPGGKRPELRRTHFRLDPSRAHDPGPPARCRGARAPAVRASAERPRHGVHRIGGGRRAAGQGCLDRGPGRLLRGSRPGDRAHDAGGEARPWRPVAVQHALSGGESRPDRRGAGGPDDPLGCAAPARARHRELCEVPRVASGTMWRPRSSSRRSAATRSEPRLGREGNGAGPLRADPGGPSRGADRPERKHETLHRLPHAHPDRGRR